MSKNSKQCCQFYPLQGPAGPAGVNGLAGPQGPAGVDGLTGPPGPTIQGVVYTQSTISMPGEIFASVPITYDNKVGDFLDIGTQPDIIIGGPFGKYMLEVSISVKPGLDVLDDSRNFKMNLTGGSTNPVILISSPGDIPLNRALNIKDSGGNRSNTYLMRSMYYSYIVETQSNKTNFKVDLINNMFENSRKLDVDIQSEVQVTYLPE